MTTQGHFVYRNTCAALLGMDVAKLKVTSSEIGGGFGGKTHVWMEPIALALSRKANRPVKLEMTRDEVFRSTGPTSSTSIDVKIGAKKNGTITAASAELRYQDGAFPGTWSMLGAMTAYACYDLKNVKTVGYDVLVNRPKVAAYRAPGAPISEHAVESVLDEISKKLGIDPLELREKNAAREGTNAAYGPKFGVIGFADTLAAAKAHPHYSAPLGPNQGRGVASGFWFNIGGESCATINVAEDGTLVLATGSPDIGGSRASMAIMAAETIGMDVADVRTIVADTASIGYTFLTGGSRVTFATGMAVVEASKQVTEALRERAAKIWDISVDAVVWKDGHAKPAGANAVSYTHLTLPTILLV